MATATQPDPVVHNHETENLISATARGKKRMMTDREVFARFGAPGNTNQFVYVPVPYKMYAAWDQKVEVKRLFCHPQAAPGFRKILADIKAHYGLARIKQLGLDQYGGVYNFRLMKGSRKRWSRHAWGIAIDLDPSHNTLRMDHRQARFAQPAYKELVDIFYANGFISYGREKDYDWMHFELGI